MDTSKASPELFAAISVAQGKIENATKNAQNPHFRSNYADLAEVLNTVRPVFSEEGLSLIQSTEFDGELVSVSTVIAHKLGGYITSRASCKPAKTDAQGVGAATTYLRRYSAAAIAGIAQEDDDGQSAAHNGKPKARQQADKTASPVVTPTSGVWESMSEEAQAFLQDHADHIIELGVERATDGAKYIKSLNIDNDEKTALWTRLPSQIRTALKKEMSNG